jgi:putative nucleotidyltransferase with HDIG domain
MPKAKVAAPATHRHWALTTPPPFPAIAMRVMEILARDNGAVQEVVECIQSDPIFAAEILRVANSALYGAANEIKSVQRATATLGLDFIKALAVTVSMRGHVKSGMKIPVLRTCWRHCMASAVLAQEVAAACGLKEDEAYTAALLHDIGRIGLMAAYPIEYASVLEFSGAESFNLMDCERELFDIDHCQAGAWLAEAWNLPPHFKNITAHHHDEVPAGSSDLLAVVALACQLATALDFGVMAGRANLSFDEVRTRLPKAAHARFRPSPAVLKRKVEARLKALKLH